jgi:hypothetical protein
LSSEKKCNCGAVVAYSLAVLGAFLIVGGLVWVMYAYTRPEPLGEDRAAFRRKTLADVQQADADVLYTPTYVWADRDKGIVRLPIKDAEQLALRLWQDPAAARTNLISRVERAFYVPPPPPTKFD